MKAKSNLRRILVLGSGGAGKSTFSIQLAERLGLEVIHLDAHFWKPNWVASSQEEFLQTIEELVHKEAWVMDGNYSASIERRLEYADTIIFLDVPRIVCLWRVLKRWLQYWGRVRPDLAEGCYEKVDWGFVKWIWNYPRRSRPRILQALEDHASSHKTFILKTNVQIQAFLSTFDPQAPDPG